MAGMEEMVQIGLSFPFRFAFLFASRLDPGPRTTARDRPGRRSTEPSTAAVDRTAGAGQREP
jgi:hypothetical protein